MESDSIRETVRRPAERPWAALWREAGTVRSTLTISLAPLFHLHPGALPAYRHETPLFEEQGDQSCFRACSYVWALPQRQSSGRKKAVSPVGNEILCWRTKLDEPLNRTQYFISCYLRHAYLDASAHFRTSSSSWRTRHMNVFRPVEHLEGVALRSVPMHCHAWQCSSARARDPICFDPAQIRPSFRPSPHRASHAQPTNLSKQPPCALLVLMN
jgi:hypothetical protein